MAPTPVSVAPITRMALDRTIEVTGSLFADEDVLVSSKIEGNIEIIEKDLGDAVRPGEMLARIDASDYQLTLERQRAVAAAALAKLGLTELPPDSFDTSKLPTVAKAQAEAGNAQSRLDRATQLFEQSPPLIAEQDYADLQTAYEIATNQASVEQLNAQATLAEARAEVAAIAIAERSIKDAVIAAPVNPLRPDMAYQVAERRISVGEFVRPGDVLFRLVASDTIKFRAGVPDRFGALVKEGQRVTVSLGEGLERTGHVSRISPAVDAASRTFVVEVVLDNRDQVLKPGAFAKGRIVVRTDENVAMAPEDAVVSFAGVHRVFSVRNGKAFEHRVRLGDRRDGLVELVGGFLADEVVVDGAAGLTQDAPVTIEAAGP